MNTFKFQLVTPEKTALSEELVSLRCPTRMGEITILPNHAPLIAQLVAEELEEEIYKNKVKLSWKIISVILK
jgi:F0F1-type ATP synthase epsilon subunit